MTDISNFIVLPPNPAPVLFLEEGLLRFSSLFFRASLLCLSHAGRLSRYCMTCLKP